MIMLNRIRLIINNNNIFRIVMFSSNNINRKWKISLVNK